MNCTRYGFLILLLVVFGCAGRQPQVGSSGAKSSASIYDEHADAQRDIDAAIANAEASKRNIVLIFGANW